MVDERTAYWGARDAARYRTRDDDPTGGDYVVAETLDANGDPVEVLLRWDDTAGEWVSGGAVNMNGSDVTNVGALDADSVNTDDLEGTYPGLVRGYANGEVITTVDPANTTTPVLDAADDIHAVTNDGGTIELPPNPIDHAPNLSGLGADITLAGHGIENSVINFPNAGSGDDGLVIGSGEQHLRVDGVGISGPGEGTNTRDGIHITGATRGLSLIDVAVTDWGGSGIGTDSSIPGPFEGDWGRVVLGTCGGTLLQWDASNSPNSISVLKLGATGQNLLIEATRGSFYVNTLNVGGDVSGGSLGEAISLRTPTSQNWTFGYINFEVSTFGGTHVVRMDSAGLHEVHGISSGVITPDHYYLLPNAPANKTLAQPQTAAGQSIVDYDDATAGPVRYKGVSGEVGGSAVGTGTSPGISCLGDLTLVT